MAGAGAGGSGGIMSLKVSTMANRQTRSSRARRAATSPDSSGQLAPSGDEVKPSGKLQSPFSSFPPGARRSARKLDFRDGRNFGAPIVPTPPFFLALSRTRPLRVRGPPSRETASIRGPSTTSRLDFRPAGVVRRLTGFDPRLTG